MGLAKEPFLMKISLFRPAHPKRDHSPSTGPALQRSQPCPGGPPPRSGALSPRAPREAPDPAPHFPKASCVGHSPPTSLPSLSAPPGAALSRRAAGTVGESRRSPSRVSPQPSWLRPPLRGRKLAVSQTTRQTEVVELRKLGGAWDGN